MKKQIISIVTCLAFIVVTFYASITVMCFNNDFFRYEYRKNNVAEKIHISDDDLYQATDVLLDYIRDNNDSIDVDVEIDGQFVKMFNQREADHMIDVKELYLNVRMVAFIGLIVFMIGLFVLLKDKMAYTVLYNGARKAYAVTGTVLGCLLIYACTDFNSFWTNFHKVFFRNDLWLLDPNKDRMILMVPSGFFFDLIMMIVIIFAAANILFMFILHYKSRKELKI